jgi:hypothetical protein
VILAASNQARRDKEAAMIAVIGAAGNVGGKVTEPELFWGLRGGGGNFGIATAFSYRLHPVGPIVLGGPIFWPLADAPEVLGFLRDLAPQAPDELGIVMTLRPAPPLPSLPPELHRTPVLGLMLVWAGDPAEGQTAIAPLRRIGKPVADLVRPAPYLFVQSTLDAGNPHGMPYWRSQRVQELSDDVIDRLVGLVDSITSPLSYVAGFAMSGAVTRVDADATAVASATSATRSASSRAGRRPTPTASATWPGCARAGRGCGRTAPGCTRTSSPTRAPPASRTPTVSA